MLSEVDGAAQAAPTRRIVLAHTAGPYPGLRQILGVFNAHDSVPDILPAYPAPAISLPPDGRLGKALRLRSNDKYVLYQEQAGEVAA